MTTNITVQAKKRNFTIPVSVKDHLGSAITMETAIGEPILWDDTTDIQWDDTTQILWSTEASANVIQIPVKKRNFTVVAKVRS